ncbi:hypothetical protein [Streptomyces sp. NBC_01451]|uniref:hypothetical protein n=1 Tax=Streptomyces sp. NBC_01451 TaxID=2903872 RepID=UPI002E3750DC|nr:hypothetical protein [Streptomyces sp. NBC_01451]
MPQPPTLGRNVHYRASADDAVRINKRRKDAYTSGAYAQEDGTIAHLGNDVAEGQIFPAIVVRVWTGSVNLQVLLDGNDVFWATSRSEGEEPGKWAWPERVS